MLIDTHAHLNVSDYKNDIDDVILRSINNGVKKIIVVGMDEITNQKAIELSLKFECIKPSLGIHPCYHQNQDLDKLKQQLTNNKVIAIGETGLDLHHKKDDLSIQKYFFNEQIKLSLQYNLPLIIHARESFEEVYKMLQFYKGKVKGVFHCLVSDVQEVQKALQLGFYIGIGGIVTYEQSTQAHEIAKMVPLNRLLLETDAPYLTPYPFKNQRNEPSNIKIIAEKIAFLKNISVSEISQQTTMNVRKLFLI